MSLCDRLSALVSTRKNALQGLGITRGFLGCLDTCWQLSAPRLAACLLSGSLITRSYRIMEIQMEMQWKRCASGGCRNFAVMCD